MQITLDIPNNLVNKFSMLQNIDQFLEKLVHYLEIESLKPTETLNMQSLDNNHISDNEIESVCGVYQATCCVSLEEKIPSSFRGEGGN